MGKYNLSELNIFVIDDDPIFMKILTQFLEKVRMNLPNRIPFIFHYHDNTGDFFDSANPEAHGIMVLDYRLEHEGDDEISGVEILQEIKDFNPNLRVISYTGEANDLIKQKLLDAGASHYVEKGAKSLEAFEKALRKEIDDLLS